MIRARRKGLGLTLVQLADRADLSHPFLSQLERGLVRPDRILDHLPGRLGPHGVARLARRGRVEHEQRYVLGALRRDRGERGEHVAMGLCRG